MFKKFIKNIMGFEDEKEKNDEEIIENPTEEIEDLEEQQIEEAIEAIKEDVKEDVLGEIKEDFKEEIIKELKEERKEEIEEEIEEIKEVEEVEEVEDKNIEIEEESKEEHVGEIQEESQEVPQEQPKKFNLFSKLKEGLSKTTQNLTGKLDDLFKGHITIDEELYEEIEEILITGDIGFETTMKIVDTLRTSVKKKSIKEIDGVREELKLIVEEILSSDDAKLKIEPSPAILVVVGVNGVGKTTSIGKIASRLNQEGKKVMLAAGDTFRAAAADQLEIWAQRAGVDIVKHGEGADPSAVIFDSIHSAKSKNIDVLICDTAGRLHNKKNLMQELSKIFRIIEREYPEATREVLLVIDATTGQNAMNQVKIFKEAAPLDGIILTKLDGTAKGGVVLAIKSELKIPIKLIGVGEKIEDLQDFDAKSFSEALFAKSE